MDTKMLIGIVVAAVTVLAALIFLLIWRSRRKRRRQAEVATMRMQQLDEAISNKSRYLKR